MARIIQDWVDKGGSNLLNKLVDSNTNATEYRNTMYELGVLLATEIIKSLCKNNKNSVHLACTVEDADFLGKGIADTLDKAGVFVALTVYWNNTFVPNEENKISIAPIIKEFHEQIYGSVPEVLIIVKSIISSSCVVRTNLTRFIEEESPQQIYVVAPVILSGSKESLEKEFSTEISNRFQYYYLAEDSEKTVNGYVIPGVGGNVYERLGFENQNDKNKFVPNIVKERRNRQSMLL